MVEMIVVFISGVAASLGGTWLWHIMSYRITYLSARYPRFKGLWRGTYEMRGEQREELILVEQQFRRRFRGSFLDSTTGEKLDYRFSGHFLTTDLVLATFKPDGPEFADYGACLLKVSPRRDTASGAAVSLDLDTGEPTQMKYFLKRIG
jgi:hypothetical protein